MPSQNGPRCPSLPRLKQLLDIIHTDEVTSTTDVEADLHDLLEWTITSLENRNLYHKKQNIKKRITLQLLKEIPEGDHILQQAEKIAADKIFDHVANSEPDEEEL